MNKIETVSSVPFLDVKISPDKKTTIKPSVEVSDVQEQAFQSQVKQRISHLFSQLGIGNPESHSGPSLKSIERHSLLSRRRRIQNLEKIMLLALEYSPSRGLDEKLDLDWFYNFIEMAEKIHSEKMQELWAKILAVEVSHPGSFSLRSLNVLKQLTQKDARIFATAANLASRPRHDPSPKILYGYSLKPSLFRFLSLKRGNQLNLSQYGLAYPDILTLMDLGLIYRSELESGQLDMRVKTHWRCGNQQLELSAKQSGSLLHYYKFTSVGTELFRLVGSHPNKLYFQALQGLLQEAFKIS